MHRSSVLMAAVVGALLCFPPLARAADRPNGYSGIAALGEAWTATVLRVLKNVLPWPAPPTGITEPGIEVEGIACLRLASGRLILVLGHRGGKVGSGNRPGVIAWGNLDLDAGTFRRSGEAALAPDVLLGERGCADLLLEPREGSWEVWSVASDDAGDLGPFRSVVYRAGALVPDTGDGLRFQPELQPQVRWRLDGMKVEALGRTTGIPRSAFCVATDDENYGGVWRPLFAPETGHPR
jgi:hypothetical protein